MKTRGKREAQRNVSPLVTKKYFEPSAESAKYHLNYSALSELHGHCASLPGATRLTLFGACPWLSYSAPLALGACPWLSYSAPLALGACPWLSYFRAFGAGRLPLAFIFPRLWRWALAPGFHISAPLALAACPWLSYSAPLALSSDFLCKAGSRYSASAIIHNHSYMCQRVLTQFTKKGGISRLPGHWLRLKC